MFIIFESFRSIQSNSFPSQWPSSVRLRAGSCFIGSHWQSLAVWRIEEAKQATKKAEEVREGLDEAFGAVEYIHRVHRYFSLSLEDALLIGSVSMSSISASISLLYYIPGYVQFA